MSQEKVDRYKQEKANRKKIVKKQRIMNVVRKTVLSLAVIALVGWLGYSAYTPCRSGWVHHSGFVRWGLLNWASWTVTKGGRGWDPFETPSICPHSN